MFPDLPYEAAFLGAVSRKMVRDRPATRGTAAEPQGWMVSSPPDAFTGVVLNEPAWDIVQREFGPLPIASRIPYRTLPAGAVLVLTADTASPLGADAAAGLLAG